MGEGDGGAFWRAVDWRAPWLAPYAKQAVPVVERLARGACVAEALGHDRFVSQRALSAGEPYEAFVFRTGRVPTRDNLHDLFNGLVWLAFPEPKAAINRRHADEIARHGIGARRGPVRDALTLLDENGALLDAPEPLFAALGARDWRALFVTHRALWRDARLVVVGHALLEKLVAPRKPITAHVWRAGAEPGTPPFAPLPVLGVPGWWPDNENAVFYDDAEVFRPPRR